MLSTPKKYSIQTEQNAGLERSTFFIPFDSYRKRKKGCQGFIGSSPSAFLDNLSNW